MQCRVRKDFNETVYLVKVEDKLYMETTDLAEIDATVAKVLKSDDPERIATLVDKLNA